MTTPTPAPSAPPPHFAEGSAVRVKPGTLDPDYPDIPLGGWAGVVSNVDCSTPEKRIYLVEWTPQTLAALHPVYLHRCDRDGLDPDGTWLEESALLADPGGPLAIEPPTELKPAPLDLDDPEDRARFILNLTSDDALPAIDADGLQRFHRQLTRRLTFPFLAVDSDFAPLMVTGLLGADRSTVEDGLFVEATQEDDSIDLPLYDIGVLENTVGFRELQAYQAWMGCHRDKEEKQTGCGVLLATALVIVLAAVLAGAALTVLDEAYLAGQVGAVIVGLLGAAIGAFGESLYRRENRLPPGLLGGVVLGALGGAFVGGAVGTLIVAYVGAIPGAIAGTLLAGVLARFGIRRPGSVCLTALGAWLGGMTYFVAVQPWDALWGTLRGLVAGVGLCVGTWLLVMSYMRWMFRGVSHPE